MRIQFIVIHTILLLPFATLYAGQEAAPKNELGFTLGGIPPLSRGNSQQSVELGAGTAFGVNYGRRFLGGSKAAIYGEVEFLANPLRDISSNSGTATKNVASLYITPGIRLKFFPASAISPYAVVGGGYADYEQSTTRLDGQRNPAPRQLARGAFDFGAGVDVRVWRRWLALRGEARDFYTGSPAYNLPSVTGGQHNVAISGGFVLRWH
ncbi:MAG: outer membrane beta-barrel protein [Acidobacteriaceae bacterium]|nr:outer membrane beta-barrel protein [Acidobacteriaceae bacterium]